MEGANTKWWSMKESSHFCSPSFNAVDLPITSLSAEAVSNQIQKTTDSNLISLSYGATGDAAAQKAYGEPYGNHQTLNYASTVQESSQQVQDSAKHNDPEINDKTVNYPLALSNGYESSEANGDTHQTFAFLRAQPASHDCPSKANTSLGINADNHQTVNYLSADVGIERGSYSNRKRKSPEDTGDGRSKKSIADKAYRDRCKEEKENIKAENGRLKTEISRLNEESAGKDDSLRNQEEEIKKLQQKVKQLEDELHKNNRLTSVVLEKLDSNQNIEIQRENESLKLQIDRMLRASTFSPDSIHGQLQKRNDQLHRENSSLQMIVEALCARR